MWGEAGDGNGITVRQQILSLSRNEPNRKATLLISMTRIYVDMTHYRERIRDRISDTAAEMSVEIVLRMISC